MVERAHVIENLATRGHTVIVTRRRATGGTEHLTATGGWVKLDDGARFDDNVGFQFPEGALDAVVREYLKIAAPSEATADHLKDAREVRDRLLALVERQVK